MSQLHWLRILELDGRFRAQPLGPTGADIGEYRHSALPAVTSGEGGVQLELEECTRVWRIGPIRATAALLRLPARKEEVLAYTRSDADAVQVDSALRGMLLTLQDGSGRELFFRFGSLDVSTSSAVLERVTAFAERGAALLQSATEFQAAAVTLVRELLQLVRQGGGWVTTSTGASAEAATAEVERAMSPLPPKVVVVAPEASPEPPAESRPSVDPDESDLTPTVIGTADQMRAEYQRYQAAATTEERAQVVQDFQRHVKLIGREAGEIRERFRTDLIALRKDSSPAGVHLRCQLAAFLGARIPNLVNARTDKKTRKKVLPSPERTAQMERSIDRVLELASESEPHTGVRVQLLLQLGRHAGYHETVNLRLARIIDLERQRAEPNADLLVAALRALSVAKTYRPIRDLYADLRATVQARPSAWGSRVLEEIEAQAEGNRRILVEGYYAGLPGTPPAFEGS